MRSPFPVFFFAQGSDPPFSPAPCAPSFSRQLPSADCPGLICSALCKHTGSPPDGLTWAVIAGRRAEAGLQCSVRVTRRSGLQYPDVSRSSCPSHAFASVTATPKPLSLSPGPKLCCSCKISAGLKERVDPDRPLSLNSLLNPEPFKSLGSPTAARGCDTEARLRYVTEGVNVSVKMTCEDEDEDSMLCALCLPDYHSISCAALVLFNCERVKLRRGSRWHPTSLRR